MAIDNVNSLYVYENKYIIYRLVPLFFIFMPISHAFYRPSDRNMNSTYHLCCISQNYSSKVYIYIYLFIISVIF